MTLEEARAERRRCWDAFYEAPVNSKHEATALEKYRESVDREMYIASSPTTQLCIVAKQLQEDTDDNQ